MGKKRQKDRQLARARRESRRRHPSSDRSSPPSLWMLPTFVVYADDEGPCPVCALLGIEVDHRGIHERPASIGENVPRTAKNPELSGSGSSFDQSPVVPGEIYSGQDS